MFCGWLATAVFLSTSLLYGTDLPSRKKPAVSLAQMAETPLFSFGGVGFAGVTSEGESGYYEILSHPNAAAEFEDLFVRGNLQAKCYALVGLRKLNPAQFEALASTLVSSKDRVFTAQGCVLFRQPISVIIKAIRSGAYLPRTQASDRH